MKRKFLAIFITVFMLAALIVPMAAQAAITTITITGATEGNPFRAYRVYDIGIDAASNKSYTITEKFAAFEQGFTTGTLTPPSALRNYLIDFSENKDDLVIIGDQYYPEIIDTVVRPLLSYVGTTVAHDATVTAGADGIATFAALPLGYYLIVGDGIAFLTNNHESRTVEVSEKKDLPTIEKEIVDGDTPATGTYNIGDRVSFKVTLEVPDYSSFQTYQFIVRDTMSAGLTFLDDINVFIDGAQINSGFSISRTTAPYTFVLTFSNIMSYPIGAEIILTYGALLNENALPGVAETNEAQLLYSNNPFGDGLGETVPVITKAYTFELEIFKYTGQQVALAGAEFELRKLAADGAVVNVIADDIVPGDGNFRVAKQGEAGFAKMVSPASGAINIRGLDEGTYYLVETNAPSGYNAIAPIKIVITHLGDGAASITIDDEPGTSPRAGVVRIGVENNQGVLFPGTGGIGQTIFIIVGISLMIGAMVLLITRKKAKSK